MRALDASTLLLAVSFIQACSAANEPPDSAVAPPQKTVFDPLRRDLDKARGVQGTVDRQADDTRASIDAQERGDSSQ